MTRCVPLCLLPLLMASAVYASAQVRISELMPMPAPGMGEWVELVNTGDSSRNLSGWVLHDAGSARPVLPPGARLGPGEFLVLSKDTSIFQILTADRSCVGIMAQLPSLNNSGDVLTLRRADGNVEDEMTYKENGGAATGRSLERIDVLAPGSRVDNWNGSRDPSGSTPGRVNSIARRNHDLGILRANFLNGLLSAWIRNEGYRSSAPTEIVVSIDENGNGISEPEEERRRIPVPVLQPLDSTEVQGECTVSLVGLCAVHGCLVWMEDEQAANNCLWSDGWTSPDEGALVLNEVLASPLSGQAEWVEYANLLPRTINLQGWTISTGAAGDAPTTVSLSALLVPSGGFVVLASDSNVFLTYPALINSMNARTRVLGASRFSLLNDGGAIRLCDPHGTVRDSVVVEASWHHPSVADPRGKSLERIHPSLPGNLGSSWSTCPLPEGGTPGARNALYCDGSSQGGSLEGLPPMFSPDGDGYEDHCMVRYRLPYAVSSIGVRVFDTMGRLVRTVATNEPAGSEGALAWDGRDDQGRPLPVGRYIVVVDALEDATLRTIRYRTLVIIAARL